MSRCTAVSLVLLVALARAGSAQDWPAFRGPTGDGVAPAGAKHPLTWSETENIAWKVELPGSGWSAPIVVGDHVFVTTATADKLAAPKDMSAGVRDPGSFGIGNKKLDQPIRFELHCLSLTTGQKKWSRVVREAPPMLSVHVSNTYATETPAASQDRVVAFFGTVGALACYDFDGNRVWEQTVPVGKVSNGLGPGASPVILDDRVLLQVYNEERSSLAAYALADGAEQWRAASDAKTSWSTPFIWRTSRLEVIACGAGEVVGLDPEDGRELWRLGGIPSSFSASPTATRDFLCFGSSGPMSGSPMYAVKPGAMGDITPAGDAESAQALAWKQSRTGIGMASPLLHENRVYVPAEGRLRVLDLRSGEEVYRARLPEGRIFVASPWFASEHVFLLDEAGRTYVLAPGSAFKLVGVNRIDDLFWASPAIAGDSLLLRGVKALYCIRATATSQPATTVVP